MSNSLTEQIVSFINNTTYEDLPEDLVQIVKEALIDYTAVTIAGSNETPTNAVFAYAMNCSVKEEATIFGRNKKTSVEFASMINGTASHVLDYDDVSWATIGHPTVVVAPVCFSMAEKYGRSGKDVILAYSLAVEVMHKLADITMPYISKNGWHTTPIYGIFGSVIAGGILKGSSSKELLNALGIAASKASGIRSNFGTSTKSYHAGMACYNGLESLYLASFGLDSSPKALEEEDGFIKTFTGQIEKSISLNLGNKWDLLERGLVFKQYPCCSGSHPAVDLTKDMMEKYSILYKDIKHIKVGCSLVAPKELTCDFPNNSLNAKFSMRYAIASMLYYNRLTLHEFKDEKVLNNDIQNLMKKIDVRVDSEFKKLGFIGTSPAKIVIELNDGRIFEDVNMLAKGNPEKKLSSKEMKSKFLNCVTYNDAEKLYELLLNIEKISEIEDITMYCKPQKDLND